MNDGIVYSERLGRITDAQFEAAVSRFGLGQFVGATPIRSGLFGQNVFVSTTDGEFVLRGAPHWVGGKRNDRWQFAKEVFFAKALHEQTKAPVPWPMHHDEASDIFGWPYLLMPKMTGHCFEDRGILKAVGAEDRRTIAVALGEMLAVMQRLRWPFAGEINEQVELRPYPDGYTRHVADEMKTFGRAAEANGVMTDDDWAWIETAITRATAVPDLPVATFVHGDYKLNNLTLLHENGRWLVSGIFDLHEARFGNGALDVVRQASSYLDTEPELARVFVDTYRAGVTPDPMMTERMPLYILCDRIRFWEFFTRPPRRASWTEGRTFRQWSGRYMEGVMELLW